MTTEDFEPVDSKLSVPRLFSLIASSRSGDPNATVLATKGQNPHLFFFLSRLCCFTLFFHSSFITSFLSFIHFLSFLDFFFLSFTFSTHFYIHVFRGELLYSQYLLVYRILLIRLSSFRIKIYNYDFS